MHQLKKHHPRKKHKKIEGKNGMKKMCHLGGKKFDDVCQSDTLYLWAKNVSWFSLFSIVSNGKYSDKNTNVHLYVQRT